MKNNLKVFKPQNLWKHFEAICEIPHPSKHEDGIRQYIVSFANKNGIECNVDGVGNVFLRKKASVGFENKKGVILQAHLDMVPQKNGDKKFDFLTDSISPIIDGDWVKADGTTLGADNGIGLAAALSVFEDDSPVYGPLEAFFSMNEEAGMEGAFGLQENMFKGDILINLDTEEEGVLYVGCAGGCDVNATLNIDREKISNNDYKWFEVSLTGLKGGHSGIEIILQRANSIKLMARIIEYVSRKSDIKLYSLEGGDMRNAIPRESKAIIAVKKEYEAELKKDINTIFDTIKQELKEKENTMQIHVSDSEIKGNVFTNNSMYALLRAILVTPNGVIRMSDSIDGLVETSSNLGVVKCSDDDVEFISLVRSSIESRKKELASIIKIHFEGIGATVEVSEGYPGWEPNMKSPILKIMTDVYQKLYGNTPIAEAVHAGLECGIICYKYPNLDAISIGPTICYPHSPDEKVSISSVEKFYTFLIETLKNIPAK